MTDYSSPLEQIRKLTEDAKKILIITHRKPDGDGIGSSLAMFRFLQKMGKTATMTCTDPIPDTYEFLPQVDQFEQNFSASRDIILTLDCSKAEVSKLKYSLDGDKMNIIITPNKGGFLKEDVSFSYGESEYDLIFVLDVGDLPQLGEIYTDNVDFFYNTPVVNIDHHISNTKFGKVNYVDPSASSTAEILPKVFESMSQGKDLMDPDIATALLTGIITDTGSFQNPNTSPLSFEVAADLLEVGGRQQEIIRKIYKTKRLSTLKLWGKILSKIHYDNEHKLVWSSISKQDLMSSGATQDESGGIIDELLTNAPDSEVILLFKEFDDLVSCSIRTTSATIDATQIAKMFGGGGHVQAAGFKMPGKNLHDAETEVIKVIKEFQAKRLNKPNQNLEPKIETKPEKIEKEIIINNPKPAQPEPKPETPKPTPEEKKPTIGANHPVVQNLKNQAPKPEEISFSTAEFGSENKPKPTITDEVTHAGEEQKNKEN